MKRTITAVIFLACLLAFPQDQHNFDNGKEVLTVAAFGDPQAITYENLKETVVKPAYARAMSINPDLMVIAGDMNEHGETMYYWDTLGSILKVEGVPYEAPNTFFYPVHGDHDLINLNGQTDWNQRWVNRFDLPGNETFFSFKRNNVYFIALSYPTCPVSQYSLNSVQYPWLESELIKANADPAIDWIYVYMHDPLVWENESFAKLFTKYGVNLVHHGDKHLHYYSYPVRFEASGSGATVTNAPGQGLVVFEAGVTSLGLAPSGYMPKFTSANRGFVKLEFKGKTLKASSITFKEGQLFSVWTRLSLRNNKVTYNALSLSAGGNVPLGGTLQLKAEAEFSDGTKTDITDRVFCRFQSLDPSVAAVSTSGLVTGFQKGQVRIAARSLFDMTGTGGFDKADTIVLTVADPSSVERGVVNARKSAEGPVYIYSVDGRLVDRIYPRNGQTLFQWKSSCAKSGVYFARAAGMVKKLLVIR